MAAPIAKGHIAPCGKGVTEDLLQALESDLISKLRIRPWKYAFLEKGLSSIWIVSRFGSFGLTPSLEA